MHELISYRIYYIRFATVKIISYKLYSIIFLFLSVAVTAPVRLAQPSPCSPVFPSVAAATPQAYRIYPIGFVSTGGGNG